MYVIHQLRDRREDAEALHKAISAALYRKESFSLVRCGDGEGHILDILTDANVEATAWRLKFFFGHANYAVSEVHQLATAMRDALANADCLGINFNFQVEQVEEMAGKMPGKCNGYAGLLNLYTHFDHMALKAGQRIFSGRVHEDLARKGYIYDYLEQVDAATIITSRPIGNRLKLLFDLDVEEILIPEEQNFVIEPASGGRECHFPQVYTSVIDRIRPPAPGHLYLIGGGPCGKIYCDVARQRGGIAIDMGAIFDSWAGVITRTYFGKSNNLFQPDMDNSLLLTADAIYEVTGGRIDKRGRPLPVINIQNRFSYAVKRFERNKAQEALAKDVEVLRKQKAELQAANAALRARAESAERLIKTSVGPIKRLVHSIVGKGIGGLLRRKLGGQKPKQVAQPKSGALPQ